MTKEQLEIQGTYNENEYCYAGTKFSVVRENKNPAEKYLYQRTTIAVRKYKSDDSVVFETTIETFYETKTETKMSSMRMSAEQAELFIKAMQGEKIADTSQESWSKYLEKRRFAGKS